MRRHFKGSLVLFGALLILLVGMFGTVFVFAKGQGQSTAHTNLATSARPVTAPMVTMHTVNMQNVPAEPAGPAVN